MPDLNIASGRGKDENENAMRITDITAVAMGEWADKLDIRFQLWPDIEGDENPEIF